MHHRSAHQWHQSKVAQALSLSWIKVEFSRARNDFPLCLKCLPSDRLRSVDIFVQLRTTNVRLHLTELLCKRIHHSQKLEMVKRKDNILSWNEQGTLLQVDGKPKRIVTCSHGISRVGDCICFKF